MLVCGEGEVPEYLHARAHPWAVKTRSKTVGEGLATYAGEFAAANTVASCAPAKPEEGRSNERA
jgi:hypothetical protein